MALRLEGTVAAGFVCDAEGCGLNAIWSPIVCTPYLPPTDRTPILNFTAVQVCHHHWKNVSRGMSIDHMRESTRVVAEQHGGKPDFDRIFLSRIGVYDGAYHQFLEMVGLIAPGDQVLKTTMIMPRM